MLVSHGLYGHKLTAAVERDPLRSARDVAREFGLIQTMVLGSTMTVSCMHSTTREVHICFRMLVLYESNFEIGYINTLRMRSIYIILCG